MKSVPSAVNQGIRVYSLLDRLGDFPHLMFGSAKLAPTGGWCLRHFWPGECRSLHHPLGAQVSLVPHFSCPLTPKASSPTDGKIQQPPEIGI